MRGCHRPSRSRVGGFTLVEVLVALFIMAIMAALAWRGVDGLFKVREVSQAAAARSLRLATVIEQWEHDLQQLQVTRLGRPIRFDGAMLILTRQTPEGVRIVVWTVQQGGLYRWSSPAHTSVQGLQDSWRQAQQWNVLQKSAVRVLDDVNTWQIYFRRAADNIWSNAQSSANREQADEVAAAANVAAPDGTEDLDVADDDDLDETLPQGVRCVLTLSQGTLTRDVRVQVAP